MASRGYEKKIHAAIRVFIPQSFLPNGACGDKKQFAIISNDLEEAKRKAIEAYDNRNP